MLNTTTTEAPTTTTEAASSLSVELTTFTALKDIGGNAESVEYDADNNVYYFVNQDTGKIGTISGDYPTTSDDSDFTADAYPNGTASSSLAGMVYYDGYLYIAGVDYGLQKFDVDTGELVSDISIWTGLNGLCQV